MSDLSLDAVRTIGIHIYEVLKTAPGIAKHNVSLLLWLSLINIIIILRKHFGKMGKRISWVVCLFVPLAEISDWLSAATLGLPTSFVCPTETSSLNYSSTVE